jgi:excisionase family DNA binding protein
MSAAITDFMEIEVAAEFLRVKRSTLYAWVHQRRIPHRKHGRRLVFARQELENWSLSQAVRPIEQTLDAALGRNPSRVKHSGVLAELFDNAEDRQNSSKPVAMNRS